MTDAQQFETFVRNYQNLVFTTALRLLANPTDAEDISQEVFLRAYTHFADIKDSPTAGGWLKTVATNLCLNHLSRYRARWTFFSDLLRPGHEDADEPVDFPAPDNLAEELATADQAAHAERLLQQLPPALRVPLVLFHLEGLRYEEIAARLRVSLAKVKTDIFRGREALRKKLLAQTGRELALH